MEHLERAKTLRKHRVIFILTLIAIVVYITWRTFFTLPTKFGVVALLFGLLLLVAEIMSAFEAVVNYSMLSKYVPPELPEIPEDWYPEIDIFIATHNEPVDLLFNTVNACNFLDYPDKSKLHIHLCDDTDRPEMAELAKRLNVNYWGLSGNKDNKGGNLNNALRQTSAPIVVTLDADMIPRREFLMHTVPFFFMPQVKKDEDGNWVPRTEEEKSDERIGFVQTPQGFYNPDLFQYNLYSENRIPSEQDLFFREINVARSVYNAPIYAGSNTLISREALEDVDYIAIDTITEDLLTGMRIQKEGYRCYATSEVLVQGQAPVTIKGLLNQRERWGRGCINAMRQEPVVFSKKLSFAQKVSYITCWVYWWSFFGRAVFLATPILAILFNIHVVEASLLEVLLFWLPYYLLFNHSLRIMSGDVWNQHWSSVADTVQFPYLIGPIFMELLGFKKKQFVVTEKKVSGNYARATFIFGVPHLMFLIGMVLSLFSALGRSIATGTIFSIIIVYWLVIGMKNLMFSLFFMWGRDSYRLASRFYFSEPIKVSSSLRTWDAVTSDVSETGMAFYFDEPQFIPQSEVLCVRMKYQDHEVELRGSIVHVTAAGKRWKYSLLLEEMDDETKRYYRQIVYDRPHSLPKKLDKSLSMLDDFNLQLRKRTAPTQSSMRKLPRVRLDIPFSYGGEQPAALVDFNYEYAGIRGLITLRADQLVHIHVKPGFDLVLQSLGRGDSDETQLCRVVNVADFSQNTTISKELVELSALSPRKKSELQVKANIDNLDLKALLLEQSTEGGQPQELRLKHTDSGLKHGSEMKS